MTIRIPQSQTKYSQTNTGDLTGNIHITKNISFDEEGKIKLEQRLRNIFDSDTYTDLVDATYNPIRKFVRGGVGNRTWVIGTDALYYLISRTTSPYELYLTKDAAAGSPVSPYNIFFDGCMFTTSAGTYFCVVNGSGLYYWNGVAWANTSVSPLGFPELITVFENKRSLAIASSNKIVLVGESFSVPSVASLTLPPDNNITSMAWNNSKLFIGTQQITSGEAFVFEWDGSSAEAGSGYKVGSQKVQNLIKYKDGVVAVTGNGCLKYVAGGIQHLDQFPIYREDKVWTVEVNSSIQYFNVLSSDVLDDKIYFTVDSRYIVENDDLTSDTWENNFPSGIWCYDPKVGLHHKYSVDGANATRTGAITTANVDTSTNVITIPSSICPVTGTPVFYDDGSRGTGTRITPLEFNTRYFVIKVSGTTLKLATSYSNAIAGTAIDLTATGNNAQTLIFCPNNAFGATYSSIPRGLSLIRNSLSWYGQADSFSSKLFVGTNVVKNDGTAYVAIATVQAKQENRGYFITPRIQSQNIKDIWQKVFLKFNPLVNEDDKIVIKYRTTKPNRKLRKVYLNSITGTWVNSTSFTTTEPRFSEVQVGDELEIVKGAGAGYLAHITEISLNTGTYTVTIDETVQNIVANDTFNYVVDNWSKLREITSSTVDGQDGLSEIQLDKKSAWIQFKVELRGIDISVEELQLINQTFKPSV